MIKYLTISVFCIFVTLAIYINSKSGQFHYERSVVINSTPEKIYPYINDFKLGGQWSPYEQIDPNMRKEFQGADDGVGAIMTFNGNKDVGEGRLEILKTVPNQFVEIKLQMIKPVEGINIIHYKLTTEKDGTRFTWSMKGEQNFMMKAVGLVIDCEKMVTEQFDKGLFNLKHLIETSQK